MPKSTINDKHEFFSVLETSSELQAALMTLEPGQSSGEKTNEHPDSEQVLFVVKGQVEAEIGDERETLRAGDFVIVPRGVAHEFRNESKTTAVTFNVYGPPAY